MIIRFEEQKNVINKTSVETGLNTSGQWFNQFLFPWYSRNALAMGGLRGDPIAATSIYL